MKYYLSSFRFGKDKNDFKKLCLRNTNVAYISNAIDYLDDADLKTKIMQNDINDLEEIGLDVHILDLKLYFNNPEGLKDFMENMSYIWITGGNVFVLNQAFRLSGFDSLLREYASSNKDIVYGGFSCATYILGKCLQGMDLVDSKDENPYDIDEVYWDGVGLLDYMIVPHYESDHFESEAINKLVEYMKKSEINFTTISDGEVIIID